MRHFPAIFPRPFPAPLPWVDGGSTNAFTARSVTFGASNYFASASGMSIPATNGGALSCWFYNSEATWTEQRRLCQFGIGGVVHFEAYTWYNRSIGLRVNHDGGGSKVAITANNSMAVGQWYHLLWAWDWATGQFNVYLNGSVPSFSTAFDPAGSTGFAMNGLNLAQAGIGASGAGVAFRGDIGHFWLDFGGYRDFTDSTNRAKFASGGAPVNLGADGSTPFGTAPQFYYDGAGAAFANQGTATGPTKTGTFSAGGSPSY